MIENVGWLPKLVAVLIVGIPALTGVGLLVAGARRWSRLRALAGSGQRTVARVVDNQLESWSDGRTSYRPVVTFRTGTGQEVRTVLGDLASFRSHLAGTEIEVFYDPANPSEAAPTRKGGQGVVLYLVFGVVFLVFALCAYQMADMALDFFTDFEDFGNIDDPGPDDFDQGF
ncbi:DUF3592 domain-containing protein [Couchioplanes azureus]|uniref:DUF3592 domain-containing protein n=1 Tax=Couchioplanes caeruleus TaxID=56438 RepID=UPI00166FE0C0|nr:DUF3592 domain-containing protein [Couchioplanes caeruleus]